MAVQRIALGSDHAGFRHKERIKEFLRARNIAVEDFGTDSDLDVDYPLYIQPAAEAVVRGDCDAAIVLGGSGNGEAIAANKVKGIRCALVWNEETGRLAREHNDANAIAIGARQLTEEEALRAVAVWVDATFQGGRHARRLEQIRRIEAGGRAAGVES
jgi:ribose 5-phosphate isomerase B